MENILVPSSERNPRDTVQNLTFSIPAWLKLTYLRDVGPTEIAGWGVTRLDDPLYVEEFHLVEQTATAATFKFDPVALNSYVTRQFIERRLQPKNCQRIWIHTHPGNSASPSGVDLATLRDDLGRSDWIVMFILARGGETTARLVYNTGPKFQKELPVFVDNTGFFGEGCEERFQDLIGQRESWKAEYDALVHIQNPWNGVARLYPGQESRGRVRRYSADSDPREFDGPEDEVLSMDLETRMSHWEDALTLHQGVYASWDQEQIAADLAEAEIGLESDTLPEIPVSQVSETAPDSLPVP